MKSGCLMLFRAGLPSKGQNQGQTKEHGGADINSDNIKRATSKLMYLPRMLHSYELCVMHELRTVLQGPSTLLRTVDGPVFLMHESRI